MATSDSYSFNPSLGSMALLAFARCGVKRTMLTSQHMDDVYMEANLLQSDWAADGILWSSVELVQQPLTAGSPTYSLPANTVSLLDVYVAPNNGQSGQNRLITAFSRTDYASLANPTQEGFPTSYWYNRALSPTITLWPVPDSSTTYLMSYYVYTQLDDANLRGGGQAAVPYWWLNAYVADLAHRLSRIYAPALEAQRQADRDRAYANACKQVEPAPLYISPGLAGYYRS
jgi:hypothetical protein